MDNSLKDKYVSNYKKYALELSEKELEQLVINANDAYYNTGEPIMEDNVYDYFIDKFKERFPKNKVLKHIGSPIRDDIEKVKLPFWLGSMDKVKPNTTILKTWIKKYPEGPYIISEKLDGISGLLTYNLNKEGEICLYTRGNGIEAQKLDHLLPYLGLNSKKLLKSIGKSKIVIRGEFIMKKMVFNGKTTYKSKYPKIRSLIAGNINSKHPDGNIVKNIDFVGYEVISGNKMQLPMLKQFEIITKLGLKCVVHKIVEEELSSDKLIKILVDMKSKSEYEIDGIIISNNLEYERVKKGNPKYAVAFKTVLDEQMNTTTVEYVEYNPSKHGLLIPRIKLKPIKIGGDTITYTTGFNAKFIKDNKIGVGAQVKILRSGDVIPVIKEVLSPATNGKWQQPPSNIKYNWIDSGIHIELVNKTQNKDFIIKGLLNFFTKLEITGVNVGIIKKLYEHGYNTIFKICKMSVDDFLTVDGVKDKMATKLYNNIQSVISKPILLEYLMAASNIFSSLGKKKLIIIIDKYPKLMDGRIKLTIEDIMKCDGFSTKTATAFINTFDKFKEFMKQHPFLKYSIKSPLPSTSTSPLTSQLPIIKGESNTASMPMKSEKSRNNRISVDFVVLTGFRDKVLEQEIINRGGTIQSTINSKTTLLIAKDIDRNTGKVKKAKELGIKIISRDTSIV